MNAAARQHWKDEAIRTVIKQGPWACLSLLVLFAVGYEIRWFIHSTGAAVTAYVKQSGENIEELNSAVSLLTENLAATSENVKHCSQLLESVQVQHATQLEQSEKLSTLMNDAHKMMAPVPAKHDVEIRVLEEIRDKLHVRQGEPVPTGSASNP